jgi:putative spermidine/putrescine transport system permease protein
LQEENQAAGRRFRRVPSFAPEATGREASATTAFISQGVIGGGRLNYLPALVWQNAMVVFDWPLAAAMALTLMASVLMVAGLLSLLGRGARHA